jgi:hypothetical protein
VIENSFSIKFDDSEKLELLPQTISILDDNTGQIELSFDITREKVITEFKQNTIVINVSKLKSGSKIVRFVYRKITPNDIDIITTERIIVNK